MERGGIHRPIKADRLVAHRHEPGAGLRVGCGEQRDIMPQFDQRLRDVGDTSLGTAVILWRNHKLQRSDLRDSHILYPLSFPSTPVSYKCALTGNEPFCERTKPMPPVLWGEQCLLLVCHT